MMIAMIRKFAFVVIDFEAVVLDISPAEPGQAAPNARKALRFLHNWLLI
jgi:hypothetical protein